MNIEQLKSEFYLTHQDIADLLCISPRTLSRRKAKGYWNEKEAKQLEALCSLLEQAKEFFSSSEDAVHWLKEPALAFGQKTPFEYIITEGEIDKISNVLSRLEYGIFT